MVCAAGYVRPFSRASFSLIALRKSSVPACAVYFVSPAASAATAACLIHSGVSKSGSPEVRLDDRAAAVGQRLRARLGRRIGRDADARRALGENQFRHSLGVLS